MKVKLLEDDDIGDEFAMTREQLEHDASAECDEDYNGTASSEEGVVRRVKTTLKMIIIETKAKKYPQKRTQHCTGKINVQL